MILPISNLLSADEVKKVLALLAKSPMHDGKSTAGWAAQAAKNNQQFVPEAKTVISAQNIVEAALLRHPGVQLATKMRAMTKPLFNCYQHGGHYGWHTDDSLINHVRTDLSYTVFLHDPQDYEGGELCIRDHAGEQTYKLPAGSVLLYPASTIHRVNPVTRGLRLAAFGWIEARISDLEMLDWVFSLDQVRRQLHHQDPDRALEIARVIGAMLRRFG